MSKNPMMDASLKERAKQMKAMKSILAGEEVEKTIQTLEYVKDCVVTVKKNSSEKVLVAHVVINTTKEKSNDNFTLQELIKFDLSRKIPLYMIPTHYEFINKIPLTINGKKDKKYLEILPFNANSKPNNIYFGSSIQRKLVGLWEDLLEIKGITINIK